MSNQGLEVLRRAKAASDEESCVVPQRKPPPGDMLYGLEDTPPWYLSILYAFQQFLAMVGGTIAQPIILSSFLCIADDDPVRGDLVSNIIFVSGLVTFLQSTIGVRLPIVQGGNFAYLVPTIILLTTTFEPCSLHPLSNLTSHQREELWQVRMREVQGAVATSAVMQVILGFTGAVGLLLRWVTPLTVVPTVTLVGLSLFDVASSSGSGHWGVTLLTVGLTVLFSQYLSDLAIPFPWYKKGKGFSHINCQPFKTLSLLLAAIIAWGVCGVLTVADVLPRGSPARTDTAGQSLRDTPWLYLPYPGQWGVPTVSVAGTVGMLASVLASVIESVGDYYACARVVGAKLPPDHAINRGIGVEGVGCVLAGLWGTGSGTTSYSGNIGILSISKVGSRRVMQYSGVLMMVCGMFAKMGATFVIIPEPILAGVFIVKFSMITAVGLSNLQFVDLSSARNLFVLGFSIFFALSFPKWLESNPTAIQTGVRIVDQSLVCLLQTSMFLGGLIGFVLDNTIPGTAEERGILKWKRQGCDKKEEEEEEEEVIASCKLSSPSLGMPPPPSPIDCPYDLPFGMKIVRRCRWFRYLPFCPLYRECSKLKSDDEDLSSLE